MRRALAAGLIIASVAAGASSCSPTRAGESCADGKGKWIEDESSSLKGGYTVIVRICVDDGGNVVGLEVD